MQEFDSTPLEDESSATTDQDFSPGHEVVDIRTWTKICLLLALTLATLNGVDPVGIL